MLVITPIYAALAALLFVVLSFRVIACRRGNRISLGDGGDPELLARMRAQGNCSEYAPFGLLLIAMAELIGAGAWLVHALALTLLAGRLAHAVALSQRPQLLGLRFAGMALTLTSLLGSAVTLLNLSLLG